MFFQLNSNNLLNNLRHKRQVRNRAITLWVVRVETRFLQFLTAGKTIDGTTPSLRDALHMARMNGSRISTNSSVTLVGSGSSGQLLGDALSRNTRTSSSETSRNDVNCSPVYTVNDGDTVTVLSGSTDSIYLLNKEL